MVVNRALAPDSKRGVEEWVKEDVALGNPEPISLQHLYRAMDFLLDNGEEIQKEVFFATADLLHLEVDLLFFDTTSTYSERDEEDEEGKRGNYYNFIGCPYPSASSTGLPRSPARCNHLP